MFGFFKHKTEPEPQEEARGPLVAIIEDEEDLIHILKISLERAGYGVVAAQDGETGLEIIRQRKLALIMLDIKMPRMNGYQVLAQLHQDPAVAQIPVIVMTSVANEEDISDEDWARRMDIARFLSKPFPPETAVSAVREVLAEKES